MRLDGFGLFVEDMAKMIRFYRDVLGFEIKEAEDTSNVYLHYLMARYEYWKCIEEMLYSF